MTSLTFAVVVLSAALLAVEAGGHGQSSQQGDSGSRMARGWGGQQENNWQGNQGQDKQGQRGGWQGQGRSNNQGWGQGGNQPSPWQQGGNARQSNDNGRYRSNILDDDDVYGYEANYPNGEVLYVNYRNSDARARRGPGFARSNSISSRMSSRMSQQGQGQDWQQQGGFRQQRGAMGHGSEAQQQPQW